MTDTEMVTTFKLKEGDQPITVDALVHALDAHLRALGLEPDDHGYRVSPLIANSDSQADPRLPEGNWCLVAFATKGYSGGYYIHVSAIDRATQRYTDIGFAKTYSADKAYAIARETQRFVTAAEWN